eukprot:m.242189 g.242189  ORF g.242189 m.242189 type:complete len:192 (-) comp13981_c0_seq1:136-711(-)
MRSTTRSSKYSLRSTINNWLVAATLTLGISVSLFGLLSTTDLQRAWCFANKNGSPSEFSTCVNTDTQNATNLVPDIIVQSTSATVFLTLTFMLWMIFDGSSLVNAPDTFEGYIVSCWLMTCIILLDVQLYHTIDIKMASFGVSSSTRSMILFPCCLLLAIIPAALSLIRMGRRAVAFKQSSGVQVAPAETP